MTESKFTPDIQLSDLLPTGADGLITVSGKAVLACIGIDVIRSVVLDVLTGRNIRNATEILTRQRIAELNLATLYLFIKGTASIENFVERLPYIASDILSRGKTNKAEKWLAQWVLGLTDKGVQNILRDDVQLLGGNRESFVEKCREIVSTYT